MLSREERIARLKGSIGRDERIAALKAGISGETKPKESDITQVEAAARSIGEGTTYGFGEEIASGIIAGGRYSQQNLQDMFGMSPKDKRRSLLELYREELGKSVSRRKEGEKKFPKTTAASEMVGSLVSSLPKVTNLGGSLFGMGKYIVPAGVAAAEGALYGAGKAEDNKLEGAAYGGTVGLVGAGVGNIAGRAISKVSPFFKRQVMKALKIGDNFIKNLRSLKIKPEEVENLVVRKNIISSNPDKTIMQLNKAMTPVGEEIGHIVDYASPKSEPISKTKLIMTFGKVIDEAEKIATGMGGQLVKQVKMLKSAPDKLTLKALHNKKQQIGKLLKEASKYKSQDAINAADVLRKAYGELNEMVDQEMKKVLSPSEFKHYKMMNREYTIMSQLSPVAEDTIVKDIRQGWQKSSEMKKLGKSGLAERGIETGESILTPGPWTSRQAAKIGEGLDKYATPAIKRGQKLQILDDQKRKKAILDKYKEILRGE